MRIIGPASALRAEVFARLPSTASTLFRDTLFPLLWDTANLHLIDPVGVVAQCAKETAWGNFGGRITTGFRNPAGLKIPPDMHSFLVGVTDKDNPLAHSIFPNWRTGVLAQVQHLRAYAGWPVPAADVVDPRHELAVGSWCETWAELGEKWAPATNYGAKVIEIARRLQGRA